MSARNKLNTIFIQAAVGVAGAAGLATGSWGVFLCTLAVLTAVLVVTGDVRPNAV